MAKRNKKLKKMMGRGTAALPKLPRVSWNVGWLGLLGLVGLFGLRSRERKDGGEAPWSGEAWTRRSTAGSTAGLYASRKYRSDEDENEDDKPERKRKAA